LMNIFLKPRTLNLAFFTKNATRIFLPSVRKSAKKS